MVHWVEKKSKSTNNNTVNTHQLAAYIHKLTAAADISSYRTDMICVHWRIAFILPSRDNFWLKFGGIYCSQSFGADIQMFGFCRIVQSDLRPIHTLDLLYGFYAGLSANDANPQQIEVRGDRTYANRRRRSVVSAVRFNYSEKMLHGRPGPGNGDDKHYIRRVRAYCCIVAWFRCRR